MPALRGLLTQEGRATLSSAALSPAGRQMVDTALAMIDELGERVLPLRAQLQAIGRRQAGARSLTAHYGIGALCAAIIWAELGDPRRFRNSDQAVRFAGLDVTVWSSEGKRSAGHLARQGSAVLRWALFEAAQSAARASSPDHDYYIRLADHLGGKRPALSVARKLIRRCYHTLRELGEEAWSTTGTTLQEAA